MVKCGVGATTAAHRLVHAKYLSEKAFSEIAGVSPIAVPETPRFRRGDRARTLFAITFVNPGLPGLASSAERRTAGTNPACRSEVSRPALRPLFAALQPGELRGTAPPR